ncbi:MAG: chromate transporter [Rhodospirillales bacterium]|jgi:chromate transporter|nr:chromate transporter [Rhodospirillales bacterium]MDB5384096.1 chromate transporter [Rhodospirillales bacterium]
MNDAPTSPPEPVAMPRLSQAVPVWARIGCLSFGGPAAQIALMHREVVDKHRWVSDARFLHALNFCMLLPGPEAQQLATYLGWLMHGVRGGLIAGLFFIIPGVVVMLALSVVYVTLGTVPLVAALFFGLKCAVLVVVIEALLRVARRALHGRVPWLVAALAFIGLFAFGAPFPLVVLAALAVGYAWPAAFAATGHSTTHAGPPALLDAAIAADPGRIARAAPVARRAGVFALLLWVAPVLATWGTSPFGDIAWFFSKMAVVTFGGAYAVLAYVAQEAVDRYAWLTAADMLAGLGLAETTPGPLILVLEFVGFLGANQAGGLAAGVAGALLAVWVTFMPCFAWIFLGAPLIETLHNIPRLRGALAGVTAAVVGVIANLAVWFGLQVLFAERVTIRAGFDLPVLASLDWRAAALAVLAGLCLFGTRLGLARTLAVSAAAGGLLHWL